MGTRGVTIVKSDGKTKVAQYGQWDHYPSGQGVTALEFLQNFNEKVFKEQLSKCRFTTPHKQSEIKKFMKSIGAENGWMTMEQAEKYHKKYPYFNRDHGAGILQIVNESKDRIIWLRDESNFVNDGLFCEWAYIINLDTRTFEVYVGGTTLIKSFDIDNLPNKDTFLAECEVKDDDEETE